MSLNEPEWSLNGTVGALVSEGLGGPLLHMVIWYLQVATGFLSNGFIGGSVFVSWQGKPTASCTESESAV